jgi:hypothetical protein
VLGARWREKVEILNKVRVGLTDAGFDVELYAALPPQRFKPDDMPAVIVIDYVLSTEANLEKITESTQWLSGVSKSCFDTDGSKPPLVVLISSAIQPDKVDATGREFRHSSNTLSSYFRMVPKGQEQDSFANYVVGLAKDHCTIAADRLVEFYSVYKELVKGYEKAASEIKDSITQLELEDLVTFHAAQLNSEGGTLDEYMAWLYGQALTSKLLKQKPFVLAGRNVGNSDEVLLGQLKPHQLIPNLFYEASFLATLEQVAPGTRLENIQFANLYQGVRDESIVLLVITQTCDLLHDNLQNNHVLCVEGKLTPLKVDTEAALLKLTIDQIAKEHQVYKSGGQYFTVDWLEKKNLRTVLKGDLQERTQWKLIGRLNELYALSIQVAATQVLGRIGLPLTPHYAQYVARISVAVVKNNARHDPREIGSGDIIGVIRPHKSGCDIYLTRQIREEIANHVDALLKTQHAKGLSGKKLLNLLQTAGLRGFSSGKGNVETGVVEFTSGFMLANGGRATESIPGAGRMSARSALPNVADGHYVEIVFLPI